jgi:hypothetical protein
MSQFPRTGSGGCLNKVNHYLIVISWLTTSINLHSRHVISGFSFTFTVTVPLINEQQPAYDNAETKKG